MSAPQIAAVDCVITIDGQEFIRGEMLPSEARLLFDQTVSHPDTRNDFGSTEYALQVYKPRYRGYLREQLVIRSGPVL